MPKCEGLDPKNHNKRFGYNNRIFGWPGTHPGGIGKGGDRQCGALSKRSKEKGGINITKLKVTVLVLWMVVLGLFNKLEEQEGDLLAEIGEHIIVLPLKLKDVLTPLLGHRIALLATDIPGKEYLVRELAEDKRVIPTSWNAIVPGPRQKTASMIAGSS